MDLLLESYEKRLYTFRQCKQFDMIKGLAETAKEVNSAEKIAEIIDRVMLKSFPKDRICLLELMVDIMKKDTRYRIQFEKNIIKTFTCGWHEAEKETRFVFWTIRRKLNGLISSARLNEIDRCIRKHYDPEWPLSTEVHNQLQDCSFAPDQRQGSIPEPKHVVHTDKNLTELSPAEEANAASDTSPDNNIPEANRKHSIISPSGVKKGQVKFEFNGDERYRSFDSISPEVSEKVVLGKTSYDIKPGDPPRKIRRGSESIEVYVDRSARGITVNNNLIYKFGESAKEIEIGGKKFPIYYQGKPLSLWIDGQRYEVDVDAPPKEIDIDGEQHTIQIDGMDMMIRIDDEEMGQFGGRPWQKLIDCDAKEIRFDPPPRYILYDQKMLELNLNMTEPCVNIDGKLHGIQYSSPPRDVVINSSSYTIFNDHAVKLRVGTKSYYVSLGGPCYELIVNGKWFEVNFNKKPKKINIGKTIWSVELPGPAPEYQILSELPPLQSMPDRSSIPMQQQQMVTESKAQTDLSQPSMPVPVTTQPGGPSSSPPSLFPNDPASQPPPTAASLDKNTTIDSGTSPSDRTHVGAVAGVKADDMVEKRNRSIKRKTPAQLQGGSIDHGRIDYSPPEGDEQYRKRACVSSAEPLYRLNIPNAGERKSTSEEVDYVDLNGDARYRSCVNKSAVVSEEVVLETWNNGTLEEKTPIKIGVRPKRIPWGSDYIEVHADPSKRAVLVDNKLLYTFGERMKDVPIKGHQTKIYYHGKPLTLWIEGQQYDVRVDAPPQAIDIDHEQHRIQIDGRDMMIRIDDEEKGRFGGRPWIMFINGNRKEVRFDPPLKHIKVNQKKCEIKLNMTQPCLDIEGKLHGIRYDGPPQDVVINGSSYQIFTDHAVKLCVDQKQYYVALGGPGHELIVEGKWFEVKFNQQPKQITVGNTSWSVQLPGSPPKFKILPEIAPPQSRNMQQQQVVSASTLQTSLSQLHEGVPHPVTTQLGGPSSSPPSQIPNGTPSKPPPASASLNKNTTIASDTSPSVRTLASAVNGAKTDDKVDKGKPGLSGINASSKRNTPAQLQGGSIDHGRRGYSPPEGDEQYSKRACVSSAEPLDRLNIPNAGDRKSTSEEVDYVDLNGDARYRSCVNKNAEVSGEVVLETWNNGTLEEKTPIKIGVRPKRIPWGSDYIEVHADPSKRAVLVDNKLLYTFGERMNDVPIKGRHTKIYYHGKPLTLWIEGQQYDVRVDAPPQAIYIDREQHRIQLDGRDMIIRIDDEETGRFGGPPWIMFINGNRKEVRFDPPPRANEKKKNPPLKHIKVNQNLCEIKLNMTQPCVDIEGKLHGIRYDGPPQDVVINGSSYQIFTDHAVKLCVDQKQYYVALGGPGHELIVEGKWFEVKFNQQPKQITVGNTSWSVQLPGSPPKFKILPEIASPQSRNMQQQQVVSASTLQTSHSQLHEGVPHPVTTQLGGPSSSPPSQFPNGTPSQPPPASASLDKNTTIASDTSPSVRTLGGAVNGGKTDDKVDKGKPGLSGINASSKRNCGKRKMADIRSKSNTTESNSKRSRRNNESNRSYVTTQLGGPSSSPPSLFSNGSSSQPPPTSASLDKNATIDSGTSPSVRTHAGAVNGDKTDDMVEKRNTSNKRKEPPSPCVDSSMIEFSAAQPMISSGPQQSDILSSDFKPIQRTSIPEFVSGLPKPKRSNTSPNDASVVPAGLIPFPQPKERKSRCGDIHMVADILPTIDTAASRRNCGSNSSGHRGSDSNQDYSQELKEALIDKSFTLDEDNPLVDKMIDEGERAEKYPKKYYNYILLDPSITQDIPRRMKMKDGLSPLEAFKDFVKAVFYIGKGKGSRMKSHLKDAIKALHGDTGKSLSELSKKIERIKKIWDSKEKYGVVMVRCFEISTEEEAFTGEACMIDAIGTANLTNLMRGRKTASLSQQKRNKIGVSLLKSAMIIYKANGERQLRPEDIY